LGLRSFRIGMRLMVVFTTIMLLFGGVLGVLAAQGSMANIWFASAAVAAVLASYLLVWRLALSILRPLGRTVSIARRAGVLEEKTTYVQRVDDIVIGCGIYKG